MFCTQCGTPFELGQNFCKHCGARVSQQPGPGNTDRNCEARDNSGDNRSGSKGKAGCQGDR